MKKIIFVLICTLLFLSLVACSGKEATSDNSDTTVGDTTVTEPVTENLPERNITAIYGMFDEQYDFIYEDICLVPGTFTTNNPIYSMIEEHDASYADSRTHRTPPIFYLAKELSLTEADLNEYYSACFEMGITDTMPTSEDMKAIASGDEAAAMAACVHPSALAKDGRVYTLRMLLSYDIEGITDDEIKQTVDNAKSYYGSALLKSERLTDVMKDKLAALGYEVVKEQAGTICAVHADEYHTIPSVLEALVDAGELDTWKKQCTSGNGDCTEGVNIAVFVKNFNISKEQFIEIYNAENGTLGHYNIDVIYSGDADSYYREKHPGYVSAVEADRAIAAVKAKIAEDKGMEDFVTNVHEFSIAELLFMIDKDEAYIASLEAYIDTLVALPDMDIDSIYESRDEFLRMIGKRSTYYIDCKASGRNAFETAYEAHSFAK